MRVTTADENTYHAAYLLPYAFYLWTFVLIARPQDFVEGLRTIRPALSVGIAVLVLFVFNYAHYRQRIFSNRQCRLYLYLLITMIISIPFAYYRRGAFEFFFTKYIVTVLYFFLFYKIIEEKKALFQMIWIACVATSVYMLSALYGGEIASGRLKFGDMLDPNDLAFFAISFLPFNLYFLANGSSIWKRLLSAGNIILGIVIIFMTGSRGGILAFGVVILMLLCMRSRIIKFSYKVAVVALVISTALFAASTIDISRYSALIDIGDDYNVWDETGRLGIWKRGVELMLSNPLTGVGVSCFNEAIGQQRKEQGLQELWQSPHNSFLQIGAETGIFGFILFTILNYNAYRIFGSQRINDDNNTVGQLKYITRIAFVGHIVSFIFLSQAYSLYWVFFIALSAVLSQRELQIQSSLKM